MHYIKFQLVKKIVINILIFAIPIAYYSQKFISSSSISSTAFINSSFGSYYFPNTFEQFWMLLMEHINPSLYYTYLTLAIISLYFSLLGSYIFLSNVITFLENRKENEPTDRNFPFFISLVLICCSMLLSMNPFFANNYELGIGYLLFLPLSLASISEALKFKFSDMRFIGLVFLTGFFLILGYGGYILLPVYFGAIFILILVPISYKVFPILRVFLAMVLSFTFFIFFSGIFGFIIHSLSGSLAGLFPYFRPLNLEHEYSLLSVSGFLKAISGVSFNIEFSTPTLRLIELIIIALLTLLTLIVFISFVFTGRKKHVLLFIVLLTTIFLSLPYNNSVPIIGYIPIFLISNHTVTYDHLGEILSIFDSNRLLLFLYWVLLPTIVAISTAFAFDKILSIRNFVNNDEKNLVVRYKVVVSTGVSLVSVLIILLVLFSTMNGVYNAVSFDKSSPTYAYAKSENDSFNRILLYQNQNEFYPGNFYPSYMQMQADIPDKPIYINFLNMESSPIAIPALESLPPASFVYLNNTERFINGTALTKNFNIISNTNENVTAGYPVFILGTQYTFDQYLFNNYYTKTNVTRYVSYKDASKNYGRFSYYSIPNNTLSYLNQSGGTIEINTGININSPIKNGSAYTFGVSNCSQYYPLGKNEVSFSISVFNKTTVPTLLGHDNLISSGFKHSEYLGIGNAFSYNLENYIPFQGNRVGNVSVVFYNSGSNGIFGFIDYGGQWYQSNSNYSISQIKYFYTQAYLDSASGISYNLTVSELHLNPFYKNTIPIYFDSDFVNLAQLIQAIDCSDILVKGNDFSISSLTGSFLEASGNSTIINPSAYSIEQPQNGWYQVFSDGAAQSSYSSEYIPPVIDQPIFGYGAYTGFAQSIVNGSKFTIPVNPIHNGRTRIEFNLLFSPLGGNLSIDIGNNVFIVNTLSNRSYYGWYGINDSSRIGSLNIVDVQGIQSINQIVLSNLSSYNYLVKLANNVLNKAPNSSINSLPYFTVTKTSYKVSPIIYNSEINIKGNLMDNLILEYSNPTYLGFSKSTTNSSSMFIPSWASFPAIMIYNVTGNSLTIKYYEPNSVYFSGYLPYLELQGVWIPLLINRTVKRRRSKRGGRC